MKTHRGDEVHIHVFVAFARNEGKSALLQQCSFTPKQLVSGTNFTRNLKEYTDILDDLEKRKASCSCLESNSYSAL
jgi:hypothetical protein